MDGTSKLKPITFEDALTVRSDKLKELRAAIGSSKNLSKILGGAVQFRLVVDTNVILGDILWLVDGRRNSEAKTQLMETIEAETIDVYGPPALFAEVEEYLPALALEKGLDLAQMRAHWEVYKIKITLSEPDPEKVLIARDSIDPDDAEFLALAQTISAAGVISKDRHISQMGGNHISVQCITHLRNYSRATAIELHIKVNGITLAVHGIAAARKLFEGISALVEGIRKAPDWVKLALFAGGVFIAVHPGARARAIRALKLLLAGIQEATPVAISGILEAASLASREQAKAKIMLDKAMAELGQERGNSDFAPSSDTPSAAPQ